MDIRFDPIKVQKKEYKVLTYSNIHAFLDCPMKYYFRNVIKINAKGKSRVLLFGGIFHDAIEVYYEGAKSEIDEGALKKAFKFIIKECQKSQYYLENNDDIIIQGMVNGFVKYFAKTSDYKITANEQIFERKYQKGFYRCGKTDAFMEHKSTKNFLLGEWKSTAQINLYINHIKVDNQGNNYMWAFEDKDPVGVVFRIAKKCMLRQKKNEGIMEFRTRILNDYMTRPEHYFIEEVVHKEDVKLRRWKHEVNQISERIAETEKTGDWYRNTGGCYKYNSLCSYYDICQAN